MTIKEALKQTVNELKEKDISEPQASVEVLLLNVIGKNRAYLYSHSEDELTKDQEKLFLEFIERRKSHEPVWYILGEVDFYGRKFKINNNVLTPRPETELLVSSVLETITNNKLLISNQIPNQNDQMTIVELGTGAGGIIISLCKEIQNTNNKKQITKFIATDISAEALEVAKDNAKRLGADIEFIEGDLLEPINNNQLTINEKTILVANLPYIPAEDMESLQFDVLHHEPRVALEGGEKGVVIYKRLIDQLKEIDFKGMAFFEIGIEQGELLKEYINEIFPNAEVEVKGDLANIDRIVKINF